MTIKYTENLVENFVKGRPKILIAVQLWSFLPFFWTNQNWLCITKHGGGNIKFNPRRTKIPCYYIDFINNIGQVQYGITVNIIEKSKESMLTSRNCVTQVNGL